MPICPNCETTCETVLSPCPECGNFYCIEESEYVAYRDDPLLGRRVADRFIVNSVLGRGSMGLVYKARQDQVERDVALKVFRSETLVKRSLGREGTEKEREAARARFVREAQVLGQLSHTNCVTVYDFGTGEDEDFLYMAMEFVGGVSLREAINRGLKFEAIVEITRQILLALREAHSLGIVHRDLKPENIVLSYRFNTGEHLVKVLDFGIAKLLQADSENFTRVGALFGTPAYMSPEQCRGEVDTIGPQVDIYALGCMLYEMVCGRLPFIAQVPRQMVRLHQEAEIPPLIPRREEDVPEGLEGFIEQCMAKDRRDRFEDAEEALVAFEEVLTDSDGADFGLDSRGLGGIARTIRKRSGTTQGARKVIVPKDHLSGDEIDPLASAPKPVEPVEPVPTAESDQQREDRSAYVQAETQPDREVADPSQCETRPDNQVPVAPELPSDRAGVHETMANENLYRSKRGFFDRIDRQTVLVSAALFAVVACCVLVFYVVYVSIVQ